MTAPTCGFTPAGPFRASSSARRIAASSLGLGGRVTPPAYGPTLRGAFARAGTARQRPGTTRADLLDATYAHVFGRTQARIDEALLAETGFASPDHPVTDQMIDHPLDHNRNYTDRSPRT